VGGGNYIGIDKRGKNRYRTVAKKRRKKGKRRYEEMGKGKSALWGFGGEGGEKRIILFEKAKPEEESTTKKVRASRDQVRRSGERESRLSTSRKDPRRAGKVLAGIAGEELRSTGDSRGG